MAEAVPPDLARVPFPFADVITSPAQLREVLGVPSELIVRKIQSRLDHFARLFISRSPILTLATAGADGTCDVSPRGDAPGFVLVLDDTTLLIPDRPGNRRADAFLNLLGNPHAALLFMIPGVEITLRVNGTAQIVRDLALRERMVVQGKVPDLAIGVAVDEVYFHCAKPLKRARLWQSDQWPDHSDLPTLGEILHHHSQLEGTSVDGLDRAIENSYKVRLY